jgi:hypothetical protein
MSDPKPDHDHRDDHDHDHRDNHGHDNDNGGKAVVPAPKAAGALTSLAKLGAVLNGVDVASVVGRSGKPLMQFKSRENGTWMFGQRQTIPEEGSLWAIDPRSFKWGYVCFGPNKKGVLGESLVSISEPMPDVTKLPDRGAPWQEEWAVNLKCATGADAGVEVVFKIPTVGGTQVVAGMIETVRDRINSGEHGGKVAPVVRLERDSYPHPEHGRILYPVWTIVDWMPLEGPAPSPKPTAPTPTPTSSAEQPRRRRVT